MTTESIAEYKYSGTHVTVFNNRMVIKYPGGFMSKKETLIFRNIASIETPPMLACVDIMTNDGKKHRVNIKLSERNEFKEQIESLL